MDIPVCGSCSLRSRWNVNHEGKRFCFYLDSSLLEKFRIIEFISIRIPGGMMFPAIISIFRQTDDILIL